MRGTHFVDRSWQEQKSLNGAGLVTKQTCRDHSAEIWVQLVVRFSLWSCQFRKTLGRFDFPYTTSTFFTSCEVSDGGFLSTSNTRCSRLCCNEYKPSEITKPITTYLFGITYHLSACQRTMALCSSLLDRSNCRNTAAEPHRNVTQADPQEHLARCSSSNTPAEVGLQLATERQIDSSIAPTLDECNRLQAPPISPYESQISVIADRHGVKQEQSSEPSNERTSRSQTEKEHMSFMPNTEQMLCFASEPPESSAFKQLFRKSQRQVSKSADEVALQDHRRIIPGTRLDPSNFSSDLGDPLQRAIVQGSHEPNYATAFARFPTPETSCTWPGDRERAAATNLRPTPTTPIETSNTASKQGFLRLIRDYFRTTTPSEHGGTAFSRASIDAVQSTSRPAWHPPRNTFNYRGQHPFEADRAGVPHDRLQKGSASYDCNNPVQIATQPLTWSSRPNVHTCTSSGA